MFLNFYNELTQLNEGYNIPYSGYVIINDDGNFFADTDKVGRSQLWTDYYYDAAIFKTEENALKAKAWLFNYYEKDLGFYIKYLESNKDIEKAELEKILFKILELWHAFVEAGTMFQSLCNNNFKNFDYTINDYKNKKPVPGLLLYTIRDNDNIEDTAKRLQEFHNEIVKASKLEDTDKELVDKATKFVQAWINVANAMFDCNYNYKYQLTELLQNNN
jgi:hypothetical protein